MCTERCSRGSPKRVQRYVRAWRDTPPPETEVTAPAAVTLLPCHNLAWHLLENDRDPTTQHVLQQVPDAEHPTHIARAGPGKTLRRFVTTLDHD